jgi:hypothetical protein
MNDTNKEPKATDGGDTTQGAPDPQLREMVERVAEDLLTEEHARRAVEQIFQRQIERLVIREGLLEQQMNALAGPRDQRLFQQQQQLDRLAGSLLGPQELLEERPAPDNLGQEPPLQIPRPAFPQALARWTLPQILPPGRDQQGPQVAQNLIQQP